MNKVTSIRKARDAKAKRTAAAAHHEGFIPCSQDMTICGDCEGNRVKQNCPRLKEWLEKRKQ